MRNTYFYKLCAWFCYRLKHSKRDPRFLASFGNTDMEDLALSYQKDDLVTFDATLAQNIQIKADPFINEFIGCK